MSPKFEQTVKLLRKLPGVGPRQAARFVLALLNKDETELRELGGAIVNLKKDIRFCPECFNISENATCAICHDPKRDNGKLLVVEKVTDLNSIERTGLYQGHYHVLGGAINPLDNMTPETLKIRQLETRAAKLTAKGPLELIIATNPSTSGEATALYIKEIFGGQPNITLTRLGRGLASGSALEYADESTLKHALESRK